ncbi:hypothetical protein EON83_17705 [bacterium]|nr:MAG: hypothetical protein EON83_17705 [bacterium]
MPHNLEIPLHSVVSASIHQAIQRPERRFRRKNSPSLLIATMYSSHKNQVTPAIISSVKSGSAVHWSVKIKQRGFRGADLARKKTDNLGVLAVCNSNTSVCLKDHAEQEVVTRQISVRRLQGIPDTFEVVFMRSIHFLSVLPGFCALIALNSMPAHAQSPAKAGAATAKTAPSKTAPKTTQDYRLEANDVLQVTVLGEPTLSTPRIKVDSSGKIRLPMVGAITVTGKTIGQVTREITSVLDKELLHPDVTVTLLEARPVPISRVVVSGAVLKPGLYDLTNGWRISEVLAAAGGLSTRPELVRATLGRGKEPVLPLDLEAILRDPSTPANIRLKAGDTIRIAETTFPIRVAGQVKIVGVYDVPIGSSLDDAIALAGGLGPRAAARKVTITHTDGTVVPVDLTPGKDTARTVKLQTGDLILVPESNDRVALLGAVARPGYFDIDAGATMRVSQALVLAGGVTPKAALTRANLVRSDGTIINLDLFGLLIRGDQTRNVTIEPGDIITVPEGSGVAVYGAVKTSGTYNIEEGRIPVLSDILTLAGGLSAPPEDVSVRITRRTPTVDATTTVATTTTAAPTVISLQNASSREVLDTRIYDGDSIIVEALKTQLVLVTGEVKSPGSFEIKEGTSLVEAINRAGGPTDKAALTKVTVRHKDSTSQQLDIRASLKEGAAEPPFILKSGDYIVIPENKRQVYVMEAVNQPGYVPVPETGGLTVGDALTKAGGPKDRAKLRQVAIFHQNPKGETTQNILNLQEAKSAIDALNTQLQPGDILYVPQGSQSQGFFRTLTQSAGLLNIFRLF